MVYDAKGLSGDFYHGKKNWTRILLEILCLATATDCVTATASLKMLQKCFRESTLSKTQVSEWHSTLSEGREVVENLPHVSHDFFLFLKLKFPLQGTRHESIEAIKRNSLKELKAIPAEAYKKCMENWIDHWHAYIGSKGAYFEGDNKDLFLKYIKMLFFNQSGSNLISWYTRTPLIRAPKIRAFQLQPSERNFSPPTPTLFESKARASARVPVVGLCAFSRITPEI